MVLPFIFPFMIVIGLVVTISITVLGTELEVPRNANTSCAILLLLIKDAVSISVVNTGLRSHHFRILVMDQSCRPHKIF